ncbi:hypothetical protein EDB81DRAFT_653288 [Dactylonectria macrodidyma]|uniref:Uncharacterized protein n=1 Tax=Dactylonectria macrodidyma TaxID=307937 RepID=A0A9P9J4Z8_9HYPO|nr:hypothetical protein EDB81DRAFT_653288 [Dactylonectria macrodidyma]
MSEATIQTNGTLVPPSQVENGDTRSIESIAAVQQKYAEERNKRLRDDGASQFIDLYDHARFRRFKADPWLEQDGPRPSVAPPQDGSRSEVLIMGGGYSGLLYAVRLLEAGFKPEEIRIVDLAGGFGGTWYWNRYPGLMCDIESYIYMPLLEETNYIPSMKYSSGKELREHAERIAKQWGFDKTAWLRQRVASIDWDDNSKEWVTGLNAQLGSGEEGPLINVRSRFIILATGVVAVPRLPQIPGIEKFKGPCFHTARWDYASTGGTVANPEMTQLRNQRVGIIGTGATAIQTVPALAAWAKKLYVFQRTPSSVNPRDNRPTDPKWADEMRITPGWQAERSENFNAYVANIRVNPPSLNMVDDGWTRLLTYSANSGTPEADCRTPEDTHKRVQELNAIDLPVQDKVRQRVDDIVNDPETAEKLKPWYPGWCKRACFHDEYLQSFNRPNVQLVDTNGFGVNEITEDGIIIGDKEYKVDLLVLSTGYKGPLSYSPVGRAGIDVKGRNGLSLNKKWADGVTTLHGMMSHDFPNLFWPGLNQSGVGPNFTYTVEVSALHTAEIIAHARAVASKAEPISSQPSLDSPRNYRCNFIVEPTAEAEEEWAQLIASQAGVFAAGAGCTPSYFNGEGEFDRETAPEVQQKRARLALWSKGPSHFKQHLIAWRATKSFKGIEITTF